MSAEEAVAKIMGQDTAEGTESDSDNTSDNTNADTSSQTAKSSGSAQSTPSDPTAEIVQKYVAKLYAIKADYMGRLGSLASSAKSQYEADKKEYGKATAVQNAVAANLSAAASLESQCDADVEATLADFESELSAVGADTSIVDTVRTQYQNEKSLKKSYYLSMNK
jgi:hypothetical protein